MVDGVGEIMRGFCTIGINARGSICVVAVGVGIFGTAVELLALLLRWMEQWVPSVGWLFILSALFFVTAGVAARGSVGAVAVHVGFVRAVAA